MSTPPRGFNLLKFPKDVMFAVGRFLSHEDLSRFMNASTELPLPYCDHDETRLWLTATRILLLGRLSSVVLPTRLSDIVKEELHCWRALKDEETSALVARNIQSFSVIALLIQYSELATRISSELGGNKDIAQMVWPMGCGCCPEEQGLCGGHPWPPVVFSTPRFSTYTLSWAGEVMPQTMSRGLLLDGIFGTPELIGEKFQPDENLGILSWHENDEEYFHPRQRDPACEDYQLFLSHQMYLMFSDQRSHLMFSDQRSHPNRRVIWQPYRALAQHPVRDIMLQKLQESPEYSWLSRATMEMATIPNKHTVCFWMDEKEEPRDDEQAERRQAGGRRYGGRRASHGRRYPSPGRRGAPPIDEAPHFDDNDFVVTKIRTLVNQITVPPPLTIDTSICVGKWKLTEITGESDQGEAFSFQELLDEESFVLKIIRCTTGSNTTDDHRVRIFIKVGNSIASILTFLKHEPIVRETAAEQVKLIARHSVYIGDVSSTQMYCASLDELESCVTKMLCKACFLEVLQDDSTNEKRLLLGYGGVGNRDGLTFCKISSSVVGKIVRGRVISL